MQIIFYQLYPTDKFYWNFACLHSEIDQHEVLLLKQPYYFISSVTFTEYMMFVVLKMGLKRYCSLKCWIERIVTFAIATTSVAVDSGP